MIFVNISGKIKNKAFIEKMSELMLSNMCPRVRRDIMVDVSIKQSCDQHAMGYCWGEKDAIEIEIAKTCFGESLSQDKILTNLCHELVHAKQLILGELSSTVRVWKSQDHKDTPYSQQPWEREAFYWESKLYSKYFQPFM